MAVKQNGLKAGASLRKAENDTIDLVNSPLGEMLGANRKREEIVELPLSLLDDNPMQKRYSMDESALETLTKSIAENGVLQPAIVIPTLDGRYRLVAGHRRKEGSRRAGLDYLPCVARDLNENQERIVFHITNLENRQGLRYSEIAFGYKEVEEALEKEGATSCRTTAAIAEHTGDNVRKIQRYIRLTHLVTELIDMVDTGEITFVAGVELSYLPEATQQALVGIAPKSVSLDQAKALKAACEGGKELQTWEIAAILNPEKAAPQKPAKLSVSWQWDDVGHLLPEGCGKKEAAEYIIAALEAYKEKEGAAE